MKLGIGWCLVGVELWKRVGMCFKLISLIFKKTVVWKSFVSQRKLPKCRKMSVQQRTLDCKDLHSYLKTLQASVLDRLYNHPATCLAVFRELPELSRIYIMRILFVDQAVPKAIMGSWVSPNSAKYKFKFRLPGWLCLGLFQLCRELEDIVKLLTELRVWQEVEMQGGLKGWLLNPTFRKNLKGALLGGLVKYNLV